MSYNASFVNALKEALNGLKTIHQVGEEWVSYVGDIPTGGVPYCGQEVNRSTYSALWEYANAKGLVKSESEWQSLYNAQGGNVAFYSSGNGSSTFRMPRLVGYIRGASSQSESGSYVAEGLPNITGSLTAKGQASTNALASGSFELDDSAPNATYTGLSSQSRQYATWNFDASFSNQIYGNSSHVTPETSVVLYGVYAFGEVGNASALDASTLASALARVESNLDSKLGDDAIRVVESWSSGRNWYRKWSDGWIEQAGEQPTLTLDTTVTFHTPFTNTNYTVLGTKYDGEGEVRVGRFTTTSFGWVSAEDRTAGFWYACGY